MALPCHLRAFSSPLPHFISSWSSPFPTMLRHAGLQKCIGLSQALAIIDPDPDQQIDFPSWLWPYSATVALLTSDHWAVSDPGSLTSGTLTWSWQMVWLPGLTLDYASSPWTCHMVWTPWLNLATIYSLAMLNSFRYFRVVCGWQDPCPALLCPALLLPLSPFQLGSSWPVLLTDGRFCVNLCKLGARQM